MVQPCIFDKNRPVAFVGCATFGNTMLAIFLFCFLHQPLTFFLMWKESRKTWRLKGIGQVHGKFTDVRQSDAFIGDELKFQPHRSRQFACGGHAQTPLLASVSSSGDRRVLVNSGCDRLQSRQYHPYTAMEPPLLVSSPTRLTPVQRCRVS